MEPRRSFLGVLLAAWPFGRALASPQAKPEKEKQTRPTSQTTTLATKKHLWEEALDICKTEVESGGKDGPFTFGAGVLDKLKEKCYADFKKNLEGQSGYDCWESDKKMVKRMARWVGTSAQFVAEANGRTVILAYDVRAGLEFVREHCGVGSCPDGSNSSKEGPRRAYCINALEKWAKEPNPAKS